MTVTTDQLGGPPDNASEALFDALIRHQIGLLRVSGSIRNRIFEILDATERDVREEILRLLKNDLPITARMRRLERLQKIIANIRGQAWKDSAQVWRDEILAIAKDEPQFLATATQASLPVTVDLEIPSVALLTALARNQPLDGKTLRQWTNQIAAEDLARINQQLSIGVVQGETNRQIARRIVGTAALAGRDGVTEITRRNAAGITRTAVNGISNAAKREFYTANSDLFKEELYVATLDGRTTAICKSLDGKTFPLGKGPLPPLHFNCRSLRVPTLDIEFVGKRPARSFTEKQVLREFARRRGFTAPSTRAGLPHGTRSAFDDFRRTRIRQLTGRVDSKVSYQEWLGRQSVEFQDDTLGKTRALLFRKGDLPLDRFVHRNGDELTLRELARRDADAFRAAGLNPDDFT